MTKFKTTFCFALLLSLLALPALASDTVSLTAYRNGESRAVVTEYGDAAPETAKRAGEDSGDALFYGYLLERGRGAARRPASDTAEYASTLAGKHLQGFDRKLYDLLKEDVSKVAAGNRESTIFRFTASDMGLNGKSWTAAELGVTVSKDASGQLTDATWDAVWEPLYRAVGHDREKSSSGIMDKLLADCPYELYWFAKSHDGKTPAAHWTYHWAVRYNDGKGFVFSDDAYLDVEMMVAENYAKSADSESYYNYKIDTGLAKKAAAVAANAQKVVDANKSRSDFEKLAAYRDTICDAVSYDRDAAASGANAYGNAAWQLIRVFDNDPSTNVVCEGYSKAFQYLCDLSNFSGDVASYIITGDLIGRDGKPGPHMWNHVRVNGRYWLVDLTNCDVENVSRDWLFFKAPYAQTGQGANRAYAFARNGEVALRYTNLVNAYEVEEVLILTEVDYAAVSGNAAASTEPPATNPGTPPDSGGANPETPTNPEAPAYAPDGLDWSITYPIRVQNGWANLTEAPAGISVTVTANQPPAGQGFRSWGGAAGLTFLQGGLSSATAVFVMPPAPLYLSAVYGEAAAEFADVEPGAYYEKPVSWAVSRGVTNGTTPATFSPHDTCTRAQILTFLYRAAGEPPVYGGNPFPDVPSNCYYYRPAIWAAERGLVEGALFEPDTPCTRGAVMLYFWKLAGSPGGNPNPFEDVPPRTGYAEAAAWAASRGITTGVTPTTFEPERVCSRAQIVTFLYRHLAETGGTLRQPEREVPGFEDIDDSGATSPDSPGNPEAQTPDGATTDSGDNIEAQIPDGGNPEAQAPVVTASRRRHR
ncbi:MAG: S-layer homology domain-containing protein [Oscillibacter sp.]|nr:S-layer homology domain-containing protein [Oscillibacter sp.]